MDAHRRISHGVAGAAIVIAILAAPHGGSLAASAPQIVPTAALGQVYDMAIANGDWPAYVSTSSGLYRAVSHSYTLWQKQSTLATYGPLSPNPLNVDDLLLPHQFPPHHNGSPAFAIERSTDGGRTAQPTSLRCNPNELERTPSVPHIVYGVSGVVAQNCGLQIRLPAFLSGDWADWVARSTDDGLTWTAVYTQAETFEYPGRLGPLAVDPSNPNHLLMTSIEQRETGDLLSSSDGGRTWTTLLRDPLELRHPASIAINPLNPADIWTAWHDLGTYHSQDGGRTWRQVLPQGFATQSIDDGYHTASVLATSTVDTVVLDPLTGRPYIEITIGFRQHVVYTIDTQGHLERFAPGGHNLGADVVLTRDGHVFSWCLVQASCLNPVRLSVHTLIGAGNWNVSNIFSRATATWARRVLGQPLSPTDTCTGQPCQYFDKGALAAGHSSYTILPLVPQLLAARLSSPVGGSSSTVSYKTLNALHSRRTAPPAGFAGGTQDVPGGVFVPYSPALAPVSGYVVPAYFWRYLTSSYSSSDGWQQDVGLPLTPAVAATVRKGALGTRHIMLQAFQKAVLTYDPQNPAPFQVERANIGADYAAAFPRAVR